MQTFALLAETRSPLAIRSDHASRGFECLDYIPGTALMGSLASLHRLFYPDRRAEFSRLFLSGLVQFSDLLPTPLLIEHDDSAQADRRGPLAPVYPLPRTAQSCKRHPGFQEERGRDEGERCHGVLDTLFAWAVFDLAEGEPSKMLRALRDCRRCRVCGASMEYVSGFYASDGQRRYLANPRGQRRLRTHTGIDRLRGTVQEEILYNREVFEAGTSFWGLLHAPEEEAQPLQSFLEEVGRSGFVRMGSGRTRGLGAVELRLLPAGETTSAPARFKERLAAFDHNLRTYLAGHGVPCEASLYFALNLHAPAILCDEFLRYRGCIDEETLAELLGPPFTSEAFRCLHTAAGLRRVTGWNDLWGLPRTNEIAIERGSVFLFACWERSGTGLDRLIEALFRLEEEGIGRRRNEGFGRVRVSDPFHFEVL
jgi:CRISPR-associated protein Csx10